ncbi:DUF2207 family protein [Ellagibacter isourolithinifaciens]|uniref:DUF2207 family protein n=1 Tax=Ellagibacter isourolithinifaciens TaxID=2137581 RepID=UPI003AAED92F
MRNRKDARRTACLRLMRMNANSSCAAKRPIARTIAPMRPAVSLAAVLAACLLVLAFALMAASPRVAFAAGSYSSPKTDITMQVETDGSYRVIEYRVLDFQGDSAYVGWSFTSLAETASVQINGMRLAQADADGNVEGDWKTLSSTSFSAKWLAGGVSSGATYAYDNAKNTLYAFPQVTDSRVIVELDYTITNAVLAYKDISEAYWTYVSLDWPVASENVTATITLPVAQGETVIPNDTVRAWGHGPQNGTVSVDSAGTVVLHDDVVNPGQYATAHVLFPASWLTHLDGKKMLANRATARLDYAIAEEKVWTDSWSFQQEALFTTFALIAFVCAAILAAAAIAYARLGREYPSDFPEKYYREVPEEGLEPAVAGRLWRWNHDDMRDFTATVMRLAHKGVLRIEASDPSKDAAPTWYLSVAFGAPTGSLSALESSALEILMGHSALGDSRSLSQLKQRAVDQPEAFVESMSAWQASLGKACEERDFFETAGKRAQKVFLIVAGVTAVAGIAIAIITINPIPAVLALPTAMATTLVANYLPRRTERGNNLIARCKGLRNWMRDLEKLDEPMSLSPSQWGELLPFAYEFGVADEAVSFHGAPQPAVWQTWYETKSQTALARVRRLAAAPAINECLRDSLQAAHTAIAKREEAQATGGGFGRK